MVDSGLFGNLIFSVAEAQFSGHGVFGNGTSGRGQMDYQIEFLPLALEQLRTLPKAVRRLIGEKLDRAQHDLTGDIKKLKGFKNKYRLRAGNYRVLFELEGPRLVVYDVGGRKDIYE